MASLGTVETAQVGGLEGHRRVARGEAREGDSALLVVALGGGAGLKRFVSRR